MATWQTKLSQALAHWRAGASDTAVSALAEAVQAAGGHREAFGALIEQAQPTVDDAERLMIALARHAGSSAMVADLQALFQANGRNARLAELAGAPATEAHRLEAESHYAARRWVEARLGYEAIVAIAPHDADALYHLGVLARNLGDLDAAEAWLARAVSAAPEAPEPHADLGLLLWRRGDDAPAIPHLEAAVAGFPANLRLAGYLAEAYADGGRPQAARDVLLGAMRSGAPWRADVLVDLAAELLAHPGVYAAFFEAIAAQWAGTSLAEACRRRIADRRPQVAFEGGPWAAVVDMPEPKRVSLCMIVRDEAPVLARLLASASRMADELIVVDTGSTDDTVAIAESFGARVFHFPWVGDFAAARNESLRHATGDWILVLDADHEVDVRSRRGLKRFLQRPTVEGGQPVCYLAQIADHADEGALVRTRSYQMAIFPNDLHLRYAGALHEQVVDTQRPPRPLAVRPLNDLVVHHDGYSEATMARQNKHARNMGILERQLADRPDDPFVRFNMGLQLRVVDEVEPALPHLRRALELAGDTRSPYLESAHILLADSLMRLKRYAEAEQAATDGLAAFPGSADLLGIQGLCRLMTDRPAEAIAPLTAAIGRHGTIGASVSNPQYTGWLSELLLGLSHWRLGDAARAHAHLTRMWALSDERPETVQRLMQLSALLSGGPEVGVRLLADLGVSVKLVPPKR